MVKTNYGAQTLRTSRRVAFASILMLVFAVGTVSAATVSQTFQAKGELTSGQIVSLDKTANTVVKANSDNIANLYGVAVSNSAVEFTPNNTTGVAVANTGVIDTLVSTVNGSIKSGDPVTVSTVEGIGEKALGIGKIIGVAQGNLDDGTRGAKDFELQENGTSRTIKVGTIPVKIEVSNYNPAVGLTNSGAVDVSDRNKALQVADSIAGKPVKALSLIVASLVLLLAIFVSTFLITSSGYASMISLGRNPLSEKHIMRSLFKLIMISVGIFSVGVILAYGILKLF